MLELAVGVLLLAVALPIEELEEYSLAQLAVATLSHAEDVDVFVASVTSSLSDESHAAAFAFDQNPNTFWESRPSEHFPWLQATLSKPAVVTRYAIHGFPSGQGLPRTWTLSCLTTSDASWVDIDTKSAVSLRQGQKRVFDVDSPRECSDLRWTFSVYSSSAIRVPEIEIFASKSHVTDPLPEVPTAASETVSTQIPALPGDRQASDIQRLEQAAAKVSAGSMAPSDFAQLKEDILKGEAELLLDAKPLLKLNLISHEEYVAEDVSKRKILLDKERERRAVVEQRVANMSTVPMSCADSNGGCHPSATCHQLTSDGGRICSCNPGYIGDGVHFCGLFNEPAATGKSWTFLNPFEGLFDLSSPTDVADMIP